MSTPLAEALDRFLEAAGRVAQWRVLAPIERACARALATAFRLQGRAFLNNWEPTGDWEAAFSRAVAETHERFRDALDGAVEAALAAGIRYVAGAMQPAAESARLQEAEPEPIAVLFGAQFDLANPRAVAYIEQRGAALVAAHETTREYIRTVIRQGVAEGWSYDRMAKGITERYREFAVGRPQKHIDSRAHGIAVTEARNAYVEGKAIVAQRLQAAGLEMEKRWVTMGDDRVSAICQANGDVGWIPLNDTFPSGHAQPLAHPYCRCGYEVRRVGSEEEEEPAPDPESVERSQAELTRGLQAEAGENLLGTISGVRVTKERRDHWRERHPETSAERERDVLIAALSLADVIVPDFKDPTVQRRYVRDAENKWWRVVVKRTKNGDAFVMTMHRVQRAGR